MNKRLSQRTDYHRMPVFNPAARRRAAIATLQLLAMLVAAYGLGFLTGVLIHA